MILPGSYANGFAPRDGQPLYPELWRGCVGAWNPGLGPSGLVLREWSGGQNHGTLVNGASVKPVVGAYAADFDGTNDHCIVLLSNSSSVLAALNSNLFSVSVWVYARSFSNSPVVWSVQSASGNDSALIEFNSTGTQLYVKSANNALGLTGARTYTLSSTVAASTWTHICFIKTGTGDNGNLYVNGVLQTSYTGTLQTCVATSAYSMYYGIYFSLLVPLNGAVDSMMIYDRPLESSVVNLLRLRRGIAYELAPRRRASAEVIASFNRRRRLLLGAQS